MEFHAKTVTITPEIWMTLVKAIGEISSCPSWLRQQALLSWEAVSQLPNVGATASGEHALPTFEQKRVVPDYLEFLREQIELGARGPEWSAVLKNRLGALEPFVGKELFMATFFCKPHSAILRINLETNRLVQMELN